MRAKLTDNALAVLQRRYLLRDDHGEPIEEPGDLFRRVARAVAEPDARYGASESEVAAVAERFFARMAALEFLPNSPTLMNAGRGLGQLAACFVVPVGDSTADIFDAVKWAATIQKTGGGTGFAFSRLRPAGDHVASTGGVASGPVSFMQVFDVATEAIKQGGTRRGANMGILRVDHPDILDFVSLKLDPCKMRNFNLSVGITEAFMSALEAGGEYELIHPRTREMIRRLSARRVFDLIATAAWACGDPGLVFLDRINENNPTPELGAIEATNPCGEQPLLPFESCTLGSINLARFVSGSGATAALDWARLGEAVRDGVHFLDNVIDANRYPLPAIAEATRATRKIGLGVMGFADMLIALGVGYDSKDALQLGTEIAAFLERESLAESARLAASRGPFPAFAGSVWEKKLPRPLRNATTTTVAPTGTISIIAGCSSGIEPIYALAYQRHVLEGAVLPEVHEGFRAACTERGLWSDELQQAVAERGGIRGMTELPADLQRVFVTAHELPVDAHLRMQAAFQRHVHAAVSKTINLPESATPADIEEAYVKAYQLGCKGVTVYRDRSRSSQVLAFGGSGAGQAQFEPCPECDAHLDVYQRCRVCHRCGWSACA